MRLGDRDHASGGQQAVRELLAAQSHRNDITPQTRLRADLGLDSMGWIELTTEIGRHTGRWLDDDSLSRVDTVGELLDLVAVAGQRAPVGGPLADPDAFLDADRLRRVGLRGPVDAVAARTLFALNRTVGRAMFRLTVQGREHLPVAGPFVIAPTHMSYLDGFAIAGVLPYRRLRTAYFVTFADQAFANGVTAAVSRLAALLPIDGEAEPLAGLAFRRGGAAARPHPITVVFDRPLQPADLEAAGTGRLSRERIINALHDHLVSLFGSRR